MLCKTVAQHQSTFRFPSMSSRVRIVECQVTKRDLQLHNSKALQRQKWENTERIWNMQWAPSCGQCINTLNWADCILCLVSNFLAFTSLHKTLYCLEWARRPTVVQIVEARLDLESVSQELSASVLPEEQLFHIFATDILPPFCCSQIFFISRMSRKLQPFLEIFRNL